VLRYDAGNRDARLIHATALAGAHRLSEARAELRELAQRDPGFRNARLELGLIDLLQKQYGDAERLLRTEYRPETGDNRAARGIVEVYLAQNQGQKAVDFLQTQVAQYPERADLRLLLARTAVRTRKISLAIGQYQRLAETGDAEAQIALGQLYLQSGKMSEAVEILKKAVERAPDSVVAHSLLAAALDHAGDSPGAVVQYRRSLAFDPGNASIQNNLAYLLVRTNGNLFDALTFARAAVQKTPERPEFKDTLGMVYLRQKNLPEALGVFRGLVNRYPGQAAYRYHLGLACLAAGDKNEAKAQFRVALDAGPDESTSSEIKALLSALVPKV
jgi:Flp pilus assembly protein TadD